MSTSRPWVTSTDAELIAKRVELTAASTSLPQRAGRALADLEKALTRQRARVTTGGRGVHVRGVVRADPDIRQYARAMLRLAEELDRQDREDKDAQRPSGGRICTPALSNA